MPIRSLPALLLLSITVLLSPSPASAAGRIGIAATPRQLELEPGARATLRITAAEPPLMSASVGRVEGLRLVSPGTYEATYVPPPETYPQVAIVVASTPRSYGWLPLPLAGTGDVEVKAEPGLLATLVIGTNRYAARANDAGRAAVRIVVPPGARYATHDGKRLSLGTPDVSHVYVTLDHASVPADASTPVVVRAFAVTPEGKPRRGAPVRLVANNGQLAPAREVEPGVLEARWTVPPGVAGTLTVTATLEGEPASSTKAVLQREPSNPRKLRLETERPAVSAGEGTLDFTIIVEDAAGNPVDDVTPRASSSVGTFTGWTRGGPGRWTGHIAVPERLEGASKIDIVASAGDVVAQKTLPVLPGPTADVTIDPPSTDLTGRTSATFAVATVDRFGNPTDDGALAATATLGSVEKPVRQGPGMYRVVYRPPENRSAPSDELKLKAGSAERVTRLKLSTPSQPILQVTPKGGVAMRSGSFGPVVGAEASLWTKLGSEEFGLALDGAWFSFSKTSPVAAPGATLSLDSKASYLSFTLSPTWRKALGSSAMLWLGVGGGAVRAASTSQLTGQPSLEESAWSAAGTAALGVGGKLWGGFPFAELRASYVADPKLKGLSGSFVPLFLQLGYRFNAL